MTAAEFAEQIRRSGAMETRNLAVFLDPSQPNPPQSSRDLAIALVNAGELTPFQAEMLLTGKRRKLLVGKKYRILNRLGAGGMAEVYLCHHLFMRRPVALKILPTAQANDRACLERFYREARAVAALDHPNIVRAYDVGCDDGMHFLVMEFIEGQSLQEIILHDGPLSVGAAADFIQQTAAGLDHAYCSGLVHRDIKPSNLLIDRQGSVRILDMGLALFFQEDGNSLTRQYDAHNILGTADFLAPEQAVDSHDVDIRADIYSLGATFYYLLTGQCPFPEATVMLKLIAHQSREPTALTTLRPDVPAELAAIIAKMMAKSREERFQEPFDVVEALAPWAAPVESASIPVESGPLSNRATARLDQIADETEKTARLPQTRDETTAPDFTGVVDESSDSAETSRIRNSMKTAPNGIQRALPRQFQGLGRWAVVLAILAFVLAAAFSRFWR